MPNEMDDKTDIRVEVQHPPGACCSQHHELLPGCWQLAGGPAGQPYQQPAPSAAAVHLLTELATLAPAAMQPDCQLDCSCQARKVQNNMLSHKSIVQQATFGMLALFSEQAMPMFVQDRW